MNIGALLSGNVGRASLLLAFFSVAAKVAGFWRDRVLASQFGASRDLDIFYSAFKVPDLIFNLIILGAISSAVIPVFVEHFKQDQARAWRLMRNFMTIALAVVIMLSVLAYFFADPLARLVSPGFSAEEHALLVQLLRIMLLSTVIFAVSTIVGAILQATERFFAYALAPVLYNLGIIVGGIYFVPLATEQGYAGIVGVAFGVVLGALMHLVIQVPSAMLAGFRPGLVWDLSDLGLRKMVRLMVPRTIGLGAYSIEGAMLNAIASVMAAGSIAMFNLANNLQFVPISIVGISVATAVFPRLSSSAAENNRQAFRDSLTKAVASTLLAAGLAALAMGVLRTWIVEILFTAGAFKSGDAAVTANAMGILMFGVIAQSLIPIFSRAFFAMQDTATPVFVSVFSIFLNILLALVFGLVLDWGIYGLALSMSIAANVNCVLLYTLLHRKYLAI